MFISHQFAWNTWVGCFSQIGEMNRLSSLKHNTGLTRCIILGRSIQTIGKLLFLQHSRENWSTVNICIPVKARHTSVAKYTWHPYYIMDQFDCNYIIIQVEWTICHLGVTGYLRSKLWIHTFLELRNISLFLSFWVLMPPMAQKWKISEEFVPMTWVLIWKLSRQALFWWCYFSKSANFGRNFQIFESSLRSPKVILGMQSYFFWFVPRYDREMSAEQKPWNQKLGKWRKSRRKCFLRS